MARHRDRRSFESAGTAGDATAVASGNTAKTQPTASAEPPRAFAATRGKKGMRPAATVHSMAQSTQDAASTLRFAALRAEKSPGLRDVPARQAGHRTLHQLPCSIQISNVFVGSPEAK